MSGGYKIVGISGSLSSKSTNTALLRLLKEYAPKGTSLEIANYRDVPLYDGDVEA